MSEEFPSKKDLADLIDGKLPWEKILEIIRMPIKDPDRMWKYLEVLQRKVPWDDKILLKISDKLYIVSKKDGGRIVKCECGYEFGDYRINWKFKSLVRVRKTKDEINEIYPDEILAPEEGWVEIREYICPNCATIHSVEAVAPKYPVVFEVLPHIDSLYREILKKPLPDESEDWNKDLSIDYLRSLLNSTR